MQSNQFTTVRKSHIFIVSTDISMQVSDFCAIFQKSNRSFGGTMEVGSDVRHRLNIYTLCKYLIYDVHKYYSMGETPPPLHVKRHVSFIHFEQI